MQLIKQIIRNNINLLAPEYLSNRYKRKLEHTFYKNHKHLKNTQKIIYALTPPPKLSNIGDQAQVIAIYDWLKDIYPNIPIIEVDKDQCYSMIAPLKRLVNKDDLIFIHSGGNLGDRGLWSENGRRNIISNFPDTKIVSLPQTIHFSKTEEGQKEKEITKTIYNAHKDLTIIGRDFESGRIAQEMFPNCRILTIPDLVLYLNIEDIIDRKSSNGNRALFCIRLDNESALSENQKKDMMDLIEMPSEHFDTTLSEPIAPEERKQILKSTLEYFSQFKIVVTDRYHGLIFAALLKKPTIVLPTVDHKLTSAYGWFKEIPYIKFLKLNELDKMGLIKDEILKASTENQINWRERYFNKLQDAL